MKKPQWYAMWHRHPHHAYYHWGALALSLISAVVFIITLSASAPISAQGLAQSLAVAGDVTPLGEIPNVLPGDQSLKGKTLR